MDTDATTGDPPNMCTIPVPPPFGPSPPRPPPGPLLPSSELALQEEVYSGTKTRNIALESKESTTKCYAQHVKRYKCWWREDQARQWIESQGRGVLYVEVPAHPITHVKAALFLEYKHTWLRTTPNGEPIPNTSLGRNSISQIINALEKYRQNHQRDNIYRGHDNLNKILRKYPDIQSIKSASKVNEAKRQSESQKLKANGMQSSMPAIPSSMPLKLNAHPETFSREQLMEVSVSLLNPSGKGQQTPLKCQDRAMLLLSTSMAMRRDNVRRIQWSDLSIRDVPLVNIGEDARARHRLPELCTVGAVGLQLYSAFHLGPPKHCDFAPKYDDPRASNLGHRGWYDIHLFPGGKSDIEPMTAQAHRNHVNEMKLNFLIYCLKVTHIGRVRGAEDGMQNGASAEGVKAHGLWSSGSSFRGAYYRALPIDAMLALAYFNGERKDSYFIPRAMLVIPWVEAEETAYELWQSKIGNTAKDKALTDFLDVLRWTRTVLLQDVAILINKYGRENITITQFTPFNTPEVIKTVKSKAATRQQDLPQHLTEVFTGCVQSFQIVQQCQEKLIERCNDKVDSLVDTLEYITMIADEGKKRKALGELKEGLKRSAPHRAIDNDPDLSGQGTPASTPPRTRLPTPTPSSSASSTAVASPAAPHLSLLSDCTLDDPQAISGNGNIYSQQTFPLSSQPDTRALQIRAISELERVFEPLKLRHNTFDWVCSKGRWEWLPVFDEFWKPNGGSAPSVAELWKEFKEGHGFHFSIEELNATWAAWWKRDRKPLTVEHSRRLKVIALVERLCAQNGWSPETALKFLSSAYPIPTPDGSVRGFQNLRGLVEFLQSKKADGYSSILAVSISYEQ